MSISIPWLSWLETTAHLSGWGASSCRSPSWPSPSSPHLHRTTREVVFLVTQLMKTPQISPMTAAWSPLTASPCSRITYTRNRPPQDPEPLPSSVFLSCVCGVSSVGGVGGPESLVSLQWPVWCRSGAACTATTPPPPPLSQVPPVHSTVLCSTVLYCTVLHCSLLVLSIYLHDQGIKVVCVRRMYHPTLVLVFGIYLVDVRVVVELGQHQTWPPDLCSTHQLDNIIEVLVETF